MQEASGSKDTIARAATTSIWCLRRRAEGKSTFAAKKQYPAGMPSTGSARGTLMDASDRGLPILYTLNPVQPQSLASTGANI